MEEQIRAELREEFKTQVLQECKDHLAKRPKELPEQKDRLYFSICYLEKVWPEVAELLELIYRED